MKKFLSAIVLSSALLAAPLAHAGEQDAMAAGAVIGATTGAVVGSNSQQPVAGALVGAVFGTIAGAIIADANEPEHVVVYRPHREYREHVVVVHPHREYRENVVVVHPVRMVRPYREAADVRHAQYRKFDRDRGQQFERQNVQRNDRPFVREASYREQDRRSWNNERND